MKTDVTIVGAGPVGVITALRLKRMGIDCAIFEKSEGLNKDLRASTFHPPTLDYLDTLSLSAPLIERGLISPTWQVRFHETHEKAEFDLSLISDETSHPYRLQCEQFHLCELAETALMNEGVKIHRGWVGTKITDQGDKVSVEFDTPEGKALVNSRFLVGADGSRSVVRKSVDPDFKGLMYPETTILATSTFSFEDHLPGLSNVNYIWWEKGTFSLLRLKHLWRCSLYPDNGESVEDALKPSSIQKKIDRIVPDRGPFAIGDIRPYRIYRLLVKNFRKGNILLAGDAAHLNSPSGGMGMNGGLHDAFALSSALKKALDGNTESLERYAYVRRQIVNDDIINQAHKNRNRMQTLNISKRREAFDALRSKAENPKLAREHLLKTSMIEGLRRSEELL